MDHFEKLLEETCLKHVYPIKHKIRDYSMMKSFMTSRSLSWGMEVNKVPDEGHMTPFPRKEAVIMIYDGCPSPGRWCLSDPSIGTPAHCDWECRNTEI
jgi:hypothetical protein